MQVLNDQDRNESKDSNNRYSIDDETVHIVTTLFYELNDYSHPIKNLSYCTLPLYP
ncbi:MAG TPA: hypothetical protein PKW49_12930 [Paludibacteraceae bacterium]|nr:hypothetical protein [Paludibacteraceae bacterium]HQJ90380.1 hypothetical protein [Paludibacteraceae bacterium]